MPSRGIPRIGALRDLSYGTRQFIVTDPGGNAIRIGQPLEQPAATAPRTRLERALETAILLGDSKGDDAAAARVVDNALAATGEEPPPVPRGRARVLRADLAIRLGDPARARRLLDEVAGIELDEADRAALADDLTRARDLTGQV